MTALETVPTWWARIYIAGPIEVAKQLLRAECMRQGLCVTIEPTLYIYTGGEEAGYVVGLVNYPRYPSTPDELAARARLVRDTLLYGTHQRSAMLMMPATTEWVSVVDEQGKPLR